MTLNDLPSGSKVYIDANILIYHFTGHSDATGAFLHRCETGDLYGVTGAVVTLEVTHRLMMLEALERVSFPAVIRLAALRESRTLCVNSADTQYPPPVSRG